MKYFKISVDMHSNYFLAPKILYQGKVFINSQIKKYFGTLKK
jgi:hypothetical protein